jgi:hypothetical protein
MFRTLLASAAIIAIASTAFPQTVTNDADGLFDSTSYVETDSTTNNTTTSNVTTDNTNTNTSTITSDNTNTNTNTNTSTITSTNTNNNTNTNTNNTTIDSTTTSTNTNTNTNNTTINQTTDSTIDQTVNQTTNSTVDQTVNSTSSITTNNTNTNINTSTSTNTNNNTNVNTTTIDSTTNNTNKNTNVNTNDSTITQEVISPPPSAIAPSIQAGGNDTCTVSYSASVQTQILGASGGGHVRDLNCERLKNAKTLYNMGMKVAAVALMCQNESVYKAMEMAGTPCPFDGTIGKEAKDLWNENPDMIPVDDGKEPNDTQNAIVGGGILLALLLAL